MKPEVLIDDEGQALFYASFFDDDYYQLLESELDWRQDNIRVYGKLHQTPRMQAFYGDEGLTYTYSNLTLKSNSWTQTLLAIKENIETITAISFNCVLCNLYRSGRDHNSWHRDNEKELGEDPFIASASFGQERFFELRKKNHRHEKIRISLPNKSLLIMHPPMQTYWEHRLVKTAKDLGPRINLTFRKILTGRL